jgi:hypothetical protein
MASEIGDIAAVFPGALMVAGAEPPNGGAVGQLPLGAGALADGTGPDSNQLGPLSDRGLSA